MTNSSQQIKKKIQKIKRKRKFRKAFILDLRNNPGGLLSQAIKISDFFLENGEIVSTKSRKNQKIEMVCKKRRYYRWQNFIGFN